MNNLSVLILCFYISIFSLNLSAIEPHYWNKLMDSSNEQYLVLSPNDEQTLLLHQINYPSIETLSEGREALGGLEFYSQNTNSPKNDIYSHLTLVNANNEQSIIKPKSGVILDFNWSPNSKLIALLVHYNHKTTLWSYDIQFQKLQQLSNKNLSTRIGGRHLRWLPDNKTILVKQAKNQFLPPIKNSLKPKIESTELQKIQGRTYTHLLNDEIKQQRFKSFTDSKLISINIKGEVNTLNHTSMVDDFYVSPNGQYLLISSLPTKLSTLVPYKKWGRQYYILNLATNKSKSPLPQLKDKYKLKKDSVPIGSRSVQWLPFEPATISWVEAVDGGDMAKDLSIHDHIYKMPFPFNEKKDLILSTKWRYYDIYWSKSGTGVLQQWRYKDKQALTQLIHYSDLNSVKTLSQRDYRDKYQDIGDPYSDRTSMGNRVLVEDAHSNIFFMSLGQSKTGVTPYVDSYNKTERNRVFTSKGSSLEVPIKITPTTLIIKKEAADNPPQYIRLTGKQKKHATTIYTDNSRMQFKHKPELINYERDDGLNLQGTLHLPNSYSSKQGKKYPAVLWIYPKAFKNKKLSEQNTIATNQFRKFNPNGPLVFLHDNIAVFESPSMPIVAENNGQPNDLFIEQLIMNAQAAVIALEKTGKVDVKHLAIMGHSYGAFAVTNLLAHTDLFKAGIAKSGAYNRTLTPFGFQGEKRNLWQAKKSYLDMSPFLFADKINEPLLLVHGENDLNTGTYPIQSKRMYQALVANNKTAKLIMLPFEGHNYKAKENLNQVLIQQSSWLKKWLIVN